MELSPPPRRLSPFRRRQRFPCPCRTSLPRLAAQCMRQKPLHVLLRTCPPLVVYAPRTAPAAPRGVCGLPFVLRDGGDAGRRWAASPAAQDVAHCDWSRCESGGVRGWCVEVSSAARVAGACDGSLANGGCSALRVGVSRRKPCPYAISAGRAMALSMGGALRVSRPSRCFEGSWLSKQLAGVGSCLPAWKSGTEREELVFRRCVAFLNERSGTRSVRVLAAHAVFCANGVRSCRRRSNQPESGPEVGPHRSNVADLRPDVPDVGADSQRLGPWENTCSGDVTKRPSCVLRAMSGMTYRATARSASGSKSNSLTPPALCQLWRENGHNLVRFRPNLPRRNRNRWRSRVSQDGWGFCSDHHGHRPGADSQLLTPANSLVESTPLPMLRRMALGPQHSPLAATWLRHPGGIGPRLRRRGAQVEVVSHLCGHASGSLRGRRRRMPLAAAILVALGAGASRAAPGRQRVAGAQVTRQVRPTPGAVA